MENLCKNVLPSKLPKFFHVVFNLNFPVIFLLRFALCFQDKNRDKIAKTPVHLLNPTYMYEKTFHQFWKQQRNSKEQFENQYVIDMPIEKCRHPLSMIIKAIITILTGETDNRPSEFWDFWIGTNASKVCASFALRCGFRTRSGLLQIRTDQKSHTLGMPPCCGGRACTIMTSRAMPYLCLLDMTGLQSTWNFMPHWLSTISYPKRAHAIISTFTMLHIPHVDNEKRDKMVKR